MTKKIFHQNRIYVVLNPFKGHPGSRKNPEKHSVLKFLIFFSFFCRQFWPACLDPDPDWEYTDTLTRLNPDPDCECADALTRLNPDSGL
jgi:hypothetical protein